MEFNPDQRIEITHDILAKKVYERIDGEEKMRLKVQQFLKDRLDYYDQTKTLLTRKDLNYVNPYLDGIQLKGREEELEEFLEKSERGVNRKENRMAFLILGGFVIALAGLIWYSGEQAAIAEKERLAAQAERDAALEAFEAKLVAENALKLSDSLKEEAIQHGIESDSMKAVTDGALVLSKRRLQEAIQSRNEAIEAEQKAHEAELQQKALSEEILASQQELYSMTIKSIRALRMYREKDKEPQEFEDGAKLNDLMVEIMDYGDKLNVLIPTEFEEYGLWGYQDAFGAVVVGPRFEEAYEFEGDLARVKIRGVYYNIDKNGKIISTQKKADDLWDWVKVEKKSALPQHAVIGGREIRREDTTLLYVGRGTYDNDLKKGRHPGKIKKGNFTFGFQGKEQKSNVYEVLVIKPEVQQKWVHKNAIRSYLSCGWKLVLGGWNSIERGEPIFIARAKMSQHIIPGKFWNGECLFPYKGAEMKNRYNFSYLMVAPSSVNCPDRQVARNGD